MKQHLLLLTPLALALTIGSSAFALTEMYKCSERDTNCRYTDYFMYSALNFNSITEDQCIYDAKQINDHICWRHDLGKCQNFPDGGYHPTETGLCQELCKQLGYNIYVYKFGDTEWGCACEKLGDGSGNWQDVQNQLGRQQYYSYTFAQDGKCKKIASTAATSQYRCKPGYYGNANTTNGCIQCPANATCNGGTGTTTFLCDYMYYKNGTGCTKCPDSAAGGLGTLVSTNAGAKGETYNIGATSITECYIDGAGLYYGKDFTDETGTFYIIDECFYKQ